MPVYKYEVLVDLPDLTTVKAVLDQIHTAICGGTTDEDGKHDCGRTWSASVHGFVPVAFDEPVDVEPVVEWDDEPRNEGSPDGQV